MLAHICVGCALSLPAVSQTRHGSRTLFPSRTQNGRLGASRKSELQREVETLRRAAAEQAAANAELRQAAAEQAAANAELRRADAERLYGEAKQLYAEAKLAQQRGDQVIEEQRERYELVTTTLRTEVAFARGKLNMRGAVEEIEKKFIGMERLPKMPKLTRAELWQRMLAANEQPARCFEELGWARKDAPKHMAQLYKLLSGHVHNQFQLSAQQVDIVEGFVDKQQAAALACVCRELGLDYGIATMVSMASDKSGESDEE